MYQTQAANESKRFHQSHETNIAAEKSMWVEICQIVSAIAKQLIMLSTLVWRMDDES